MKRSTASRAVLIITCEHGGNRIPARYVSLFHGAEALLESHQGWDRGALTLARLLARSLHRPLWAVTWSRLLVDANRAPTNRRIWSDITRRLPKEERERILTRWWRPHRERVERAIAAAIEGGDSVVHVAVHSFNASLDGEVRNADIGLLYDSRRKREARFCRKWGAVLQALDPTLRVRYNYPYRGADDGLATWMRRRFPERCYLGIEFEINQARVEAPSWPETQWTVAESLRSLM